MVKPPAAFIKRLSENGLPRRRSVQEIDDLALYYLDLTPLKLLASAETPFVVAGRLSGRPAVGAPEIEGVLESMAPRRTSLVGDFVVLVIGGQLGELPPRLRSRLKNSRIAILDGRDIDAIEEDDPPNASRNAMLGAALASWLSRSELSPYRPGEPASGERFFGREDLIRDARKGSRGTVLGIAGCRRIGKTSVLREIRRRFLREFGDRLRTADIYGSVYEKNPSMVLTTLVEHLYTGQPDVERVATDPDLGRKLPNVLQSLTDRVPKDAPRLEIAVFIDEIDELIAGDARQGYTLVRTLRSAFQGQPHRWLFYAGFRRVMEEAANDNSEFHNFGTVEFLEGLKRSETIQMIETPLRNLGIEVGDDYTSLIYQETRGRPELVQVYCDALISAYDADDALPPPYALVSRVVGLSVFEQKMNAMFFANASTEEQLLAFLLITRWSESGKPFDEFEFGITEADDLLVQHRLELDFNEIRRLLSNLRLLSVIEPMQGTSRYRLAVPALVNYILSHDVKRLLRKLLRHITPSGSWRPSGPSLPS
jgi:hypothetical protein